LNRFRIFAGPVISLNRFAGLQSKQNNCEIRRDASKSLYLGSERIFLVSMPEAADFGMNVADKDVLSMVTASHPQKRPRFELWRGKTGIFAITMVWPVEC